VRSEDPALGDDYATMAPFFFEEGRPAVSFPFIGRERARVSETCSVRPPSAVKNVFLFFFGRTSLPPVAVQCVAFFFFDAEGGLTSFFDSDRYL